jgi:hypothetical protein
MKFRHIVLFSGERFDVPQCVQRIDHRATHGWQLRYGGTKLFSDHSSDGSGAAAALEAATKELVKRMSALPAPTTLQLAPSANKSSDLPPGISGPIVRERRGGRVRDCSLAILLPRFGKSPLRRSLYIGTEHTYTKEKFKEALKEATALRAAAEEAYHVAATKARKSDARALLNMMAQSKAANGGKIGAMAGGLAKNKAEGAPQVTPARKLRTKAAAPAARKSAAKTAVKAVKKVAAKVAKAAKPAKAAKAVKAVKAVKAAKVVKAKAVKAVKAVKAAKPAKVAKKVAKVAKAAKPMKAAKAAPKKAAAKSFIVSKRGRG